MFLLVGFYCNFFNLSDEKTFIDDRVMCLNLILLNH